MRIILTQRGYDSLKKVDDGYELICDEEYTCQGYQELSHLGEVILTIEDEEDED